MPLPEAITVPGLGKPSPYYAHAVRHGDTLYLSGIGGSGPDGEFVALGDAEAQARQAFANLRTIMQAMGGDLRHVLRLITYVSDIRCHPQVMAVRAEAFGDWTPASTFVCVNNLPRDGMLLAIDVIAAVPD